MNPIEAYPLTWPERQARTRHEPYVDLAIDLRPNAERPIERWFGHIHKGDTPSTKPEAAIVDVWIGEWLDERKEASGE